MTLESWKAQYPSFLYPGEQTISTPEGVPFPGTRRALAWYRPDGWFRTGRRLRCFDLVVLVVLSRCRSRPTSGSLYGLRPRRPAVVALCHNVLPHERKPYDVPLMRRCCGASTGSWSTRPSRPRLARDLAPGTPVADRRRCPPHLPTPPGGAPRRRPRRRAGAAHGCCSSAWSARTRGSTCCCARWPRSTGVSLTVAGEFWGGVDETRALISSLGLADRVTLRPGYVPADEVPGLFADADALVLPYRSATAVAERLHGLRARRPGDRHPCGRAGRPRTEGVDGVLCEPDDVESLTDALKRFYAPGEPARLRAGVKPVDAEPHWALYLDQLLSR